MWQNNNILEELRHLAPTLALLEKKEPFKIPTSYFNTNADAWENKEAPTLSVKKQNNFLVPKDYFSTLESKIITTLENLETDQLSLNKAYKQNKHFVVPENYFQTLENNIWLSIKDNELSEFTNQLQKDNNFTVPNNYFETLHDRIFETLQQADPEILAKTDIGKTSFNLPDGYFNNFEERLKERIAKEDTHKAEKESKLVPLNPERPTKSNTDTAPDAPTKGIIKKLTPWATAIAAMLTLFVGLNFWLNDTSNDGTKQTAFNLSKAIEESDISTEAFRDYVLDNADEFDEESIFVARGYYDANYKFFEKSDLENIDPAVLRDYYEDEIL